MPPVTTGPGPQRDVRPSRLQQALESLEGWWQLIAVALGAALLWGGFVLPWLGAMEARVILAGFPLVMLALGALALQEARGLARTLGLLALLCAAVASGTRIVQVIWPPAPFGTAALSQAAPDAAIEVPAGMDELVVTVHGELDERASSDSIGYTLWLERGGAQRLVQGTLSREVQRSGGGGGALGGGMPSARTIVHATEPHHLVLPGPGTVRVWVGALDQDQARRSSNQPALRVAIARVPAGAHAGELALLLAVAGAALAQALAARRGRRMALTALVAAVAVFTMVAGRWFNPDSPLMFAMGAVLLGGCAGGLGGWLGGALLARLARPRAAPTRDPRGDSGPARS